MFRYYSFIDMGAFFAIAYYPIFEGPLQVGSSLEPSVGCAACREGTQAIGGCGG